ncbi:Eukaryotic translation initiation factor 3 subunit C [Dissophora ornata]|nr:Eukaryotic translation initiation factor 3 subunit C [Dissophora ornata]
MSRFFRAGESDSDDTESDYSEEVSASESEDHSDSDSDSDASDSDDQGAAKKSGRGRLFEGAFSDSESEDDTVRVVRSAKDKRFEEIEQAVTSMANGQKINDWVSVQNGKIKFRSKSITISLGGQYYLPSKYGSRTSKRGHDASVCKSSIMMPSWHFHKMPIMGFTMLPKRVPNG